MAKVYAAPKEIKEPDFNLLHTGSDGYNLYQKAEDNYIQQVQEYAKRCGNGPVRGEIINFGVADGSASYVVFSTTPAALIHLRIGDAYQFQYANLLTGPAIKQQVQQQKSLNRLFAGR
jgi:hypothetical protein